MKRFVYFFIVCVLISITSANAQVTHTQTNVSERPQNPDVLTFYVLGDWGTGFQTQEPVANALAHNLSQVPTNKKVAPFAIELGDNIYESGLPYHPSSDALIYAWNDPEVFNLFENTFGQVYSHVTYQNAPITFHVIPGNHDYDGNSQKKDKKYGDVLLQETKGEQLYPNWWQYYPIDHSVANVKDTNDFREYVHLRTYVDNHGIFGLTLPQKLNLPNQDKVVVIAIDTQILLEMYEEDEDEILEQHWTRLSDILIAHANTPWKIIIGHHPIASWGLHGGAQGGIKGTFRYTIGMMQDLKDGDYKKFRQQLATIMKKHDVHLYLSGHDHNLQFIELKEHDTELLGNQAGFYQIISGSAGKLSKADDDHKAITIHDQQKGLVRMDVTENTCWIEFLSYDVNTGNDISLSTWKIEKGKQSEAK